MGGLRLGDGSRRGGAPLSNRRNIGIVCYPTLGGSGVIATGLAVGLAQRGHRVHVICNAPPQRPLPVMDNLALHQVAAADYPLFDHPPYAIALASALVEIHERHRLDVVNAHYAIPHAASAYLARQALGNAAPRIVTTLHGTDVTRLGADPRYRSITRFTVAASDGITVPSHYLREEAYRCLALPADLAVEVIPNFVDTDAFAPPTQRARARLDALFTAPPEVPGAPVLAHVSNFRPVKRTADLIDVLARVRRVLPARLVLVGDGPDRAGAIRRAEELQLLDRVRFLGTDPSFVDVLRHADAFVLASETESFGVAALEALSCGVPVCAYRVGGLPEVVTADVGRLVEPFDLDALARAIVEVVSEPARRALGIAARERARTQFDRDAAIDRYEAYFDTVVRSVRDPHEAN